MELFIYMRTASKTFISTILAAGVFTASMTASAAVSQNPLVLVEGVAPNMLLTLDDSGSMRFAFSPDTIGSDSDTKRVKSSDFNPMYYNPNIKYEIPVFFDENGKEITLSTSFTRAYHNGFDTSVGSVDLSKSYQVSWDVPIDKKPSDYSYSSSTNYTAPTGRLYRLAENPNDFSSRDRTRGVPAYYYKYNQSAGCTKTNDNCYSRVNVGADERQNFAIWYSFYRNRALATLSAASIAFSTLESNIRISWQALNACNSLDNSATACKSTFGPYTEKQKGDLYSWLKTMPFDGGTPLRDSLKRAGDFLTKEKAWQKYPLGNGINNAENTLACRPSYHVLMTDGMWNGVVTAPSPLKHDNTAFNLPDGRQYTAKSPYKSNSSETLADLAMHYWATDLRPGLANRVPTYIPYKNANPDTEYWDPRNNPANWQHMSNFIVGLALTNSLSDASVPWGGGTHEGQGYQNLLSGTAWPAASSGSNNNVYDLWHAAINSRGEFYSVDSPEDMVKAFRDILSRIAERQSTASMPAISSEVVDEGEGDTATQQLYSYFYQSSFDSTDWSGSLQKLKRYTKYIDGERKDFKELIWQASADAWESRNIVMAKNSNTLHKFTTANASVALKNALNKTPEGQVDNKWTERLEYIRGNRSKEGNPYRVRSSIFGDFLGSQPVVVAGARYLVSAANKIEGNNKYSAFLDEQKSRRSQLYVGGNAGMLHAFDTSEGKEKFAFVPTAVFDKLSRLTDPKYSHQFYVDGTPVVADVYDGNNWRTVLIGTLGAGGKGIFALDITDPDGIKLLWEKGEDDFGAVKLGYSFSRPTVARLHNGRWAVVTGNGYEAAGASNGKAALYVIDAINGTLIKSLEVQGEGSENGLSTPKLVDFDADGIADYAYAGDLQGNLWRFDLLGQSANPNRTDGPIYGDKTGSTNNFKVSYGGKPMLKARVAAVDINNEPIIAKQPITAPPTIIRHPNRTGYLVVVGTGKYFEDGDGKGAPYVQSVYGIWDEKTKAEPTSELTINRNSLVQQSFIEEVVAYNAVANVNRDARIVSDNPVNWEVNRGWVLDLKLGSELSGEMVINDMVSVGNTLLFQTLIPNDDPCAHGAGNWMYAINPVTGGKTLRHVFDTRYEADGKIQIVSGIKFGDPGGVPLNFTPDGAEIPSSSGPEGINISDMISRQTWRMVPDP